MQAIRPYTEDSQAEFDEAYHDGQADYYDQYASNPHICGTPGWHGYCKGQSAAHQMARHVPNFDMDDTPYLAHCDDAGTGEGRYHGRM